MGQIKVEKNAGGIQGLCVIEPTVHGDARGYFMETYNQKDMEEAGLIIFSFVFEFDNCRFPISFVHFFITKMDPDNTGNDFPESGNAPSSSKGNF